MAHPSAKVDRRRLRRNLNRSTSVIYMLDDELRFTFCNQEWDRFAAANGGVGLEGAGQLGRCLLDSLSEQLRPFFQSAFQEVRETRQNWEHRYECPSSTLQRTFLMVIAPSPEGEGFIVVNSLIVERPHEAKPCSHLENIYADAEGKITMCGRCRKSRVLTPETDAEAEWNWVPAHLEGRRAINHVLCATCFNIYYPNLAPHWSA